MTRILIGTSAKNKAENYIYATGIDAVNKKFIPAKKVATLSSASYMATDNTRALVYVVGEIAGKTSPISVWSYENWTDGHLAKVDSGSMGLCHIAVDSENRFLFTAAYTGGCVESWRLSLEGIPESLISRIVRKGYGPVEQRQQSAHPHSVTLTPDRSILCVCDLGSDELIFYEIEKEQGLLLEKPGWQLSLPPGSGPRHMVFAPDRQNAYLLSELSRQLFHLQYSDQKGFAIKESMQLPESNPFPSREIGAAAIRITKDGRFLYTSNRGDDSLVSVAISPDGSFGAISRYDAGGQHPRDFILSDADHYLVCACRFSNLLTLFARNEVDGSLHLLDRLEGIEEPVCVLEMPGKKEEQ